jgi:hypothetical protein
MLLLTLEREDFSQTFLLLINRAKYCLDPEPEPEPKLFQSRNRNRNKSLWFHIAGFEVIYTVPYRLYRGCCLRSAPVYPIWHCPGTLEILNVFLLWLHAEPGRDHSPDPFSYDLRNKKNYLI